MGRRKGYKRKTTQTSGMLPFILEEVDSDEGNAITPRAGLISLAEIARAMKLHDVVRQQVQVKQRARGFDDWAFIESLLTLIADGGECLDDLRVLQSDATFQDLLGHGIPSPSAAKKYLYGFHDDELFSDDQAMLDASFVPSESVPLMGLGRVNDYLIRQAQHSTTEKVATLDQDATIIESDKACAKMTYEGVRGYQPMFVQWAEQDLIMADELREGNVPAGKDVLRVAQRAFEALPDDIEQVYYRGDSASYNHELLNWLREEDSQTGRPRAIFAVSAVMTPELRRAVMACKQWHRDPDDPCRSWGEVDFVPSAPSAKKGRKPDRYLGIRIEPRQGELFADGSEVKYYAVVTNDFEREGLELLTWHRQKAGTIEHANDTLKNDLAAGTLPCERFGANAAWLRLNVLVYNLLSVLRRTTLPKELQKARPKRIRFHLFAVAAMLVRHARRKILRVSAVLERLVVRLSEVRRRINRQAARWALYADTG